MVHTRAIAAVLLEIIIGLSAAHASDIMLFPGEVFYDTNVDQQKFVLTFVNASKNKAGRCVGSWERLTGKVYAECAEFTTYKPLLDPDTDKTTVYQLRPSKSQAGDNPFLSVISAIWQREASSGKLQFCVLGNWKETCVLAQDAPQ